MRTLTLARMGRALLLAAAVIMLPQLASAQLPVTTKSLVLQDADAGGSITINPASDVTSYTLTLPATKGPLGSFLYSSNTDGGLSWSNAPTAAGWTPRWSGSAVEWIDPAGASNPNWSLTGNADAAGLKLGVLAGTNGFDLVTDNTQRMTIEGDGDILINNATGNTSIGRAASTLTVDAGTVDINGATTIDGATIGITGTTTVLGITNVNTSGIAATSIGGVGGTTTLTGTVNLSGAASVLQMQGDAGAAGEVLVSKGGSNAPAWESITEAVGIRKAGVAALAAGNYETVDITVTDLVSTDAIIVTVQGGSSAVVPNVVRDDAADKFKVVFSAAATGATVSYMVIAQK